MSSTLRDGCRATACALALLLPLQGCVLFSPQVRFDLDTENPGLAGDLQKERKRAYLFVQRLEGAAATHSELRSGLAVTLVPIGAVATYKGIASSGNGTTKLISKLGIAGASIFGLGEYFYSSPRQRVYFEGMKAALCIVGATDPYDFASEFPGFVADLKRLENDLGTLRDREARVRELLAANPTSALAPGAQASLKNAAAVIASADSVELSASALKYQIQHAGAELYKRMYALAVEIDIEVQKTEPDLASLRGISSRVAGSVAVPSSQPAAPVSLTAAGQRASRAGPPSGPAPPRSPPDADAPLRTAIQQLDNTARETARRALAVNGLVRASAERARVVAASPACTLTIPSNFRVDPPDERREVKVPSTTVFTVTGGSGAIRASINGTQTDKVKASASNANGANIVTLVVDAGAEPGTYSLFIQDATETNRKSIAIVVPQPPADSDPAGAR